jgi:hypothetical protein
MNIMGDVWRDLARLQVFKEDRTPCSSLSIPGRSKRFFYSPKVHKISRVHPVYYSGISAGIFVTGFKNQYNYSPFCS